MRGGNNHSGQGSESYRPDVINFKLCHATVAARTNTFKRFSTPNSRNMFSPCAAIGFPLFRGVISVGGRRTKSREKYGEQNNNFTAVRDMTGPTLSVPVLRRVNSVRG